ncbi:MAG: ATP-binding cassette domain-containing protein [Oscillospiraceae bacterium]|jgi:energy-coupling factor transport system ATP-binding protein|nr:ATP-binding cassette domain-containing protein [Oscillospiraceae bacterium]
MEFIKTENLGFKYKNTNNFIFKDVNVSINKGDFIAVLGRSSSGKTTFLKQFKSFLMPQSQQEGNILLNGQNLNSVPDYMQNRKIYYMPQEFNAQYIMKKTIDEITFGMEYLGIKQTDVKTRLAEICNILNISHMLNEDMSSLSGGQKQLIRLASAVILKPDMIILDEPLSQLDPLTSKTFIDILAKINKDFSITILLSSSNLNYIYENAGKIFLIDNHAKIHSINKDNLCLYAQSNEYLLNCLPIIYQIYIKNSFSGINPDTSIKHTKKYLSENFKDIRLKKENIKINNANSEKNKILNIQSIWFKYEFHSEDILKNLSMDVYDGEIISFVGNNGCGKSTLLQIICKINLPYMGKIIYNNKPLNKYKDQELFLNNISFLPQYSPVLLTEDIVYDNLNSIKNCTENVNDAAIKNICEELGITSLLNDNMNTLSMGSKQLVALAKLILTSPKLLLLDEPTINLDYIQKKRLKNILNNITKKGASVLIASNDLDFCAEISNRCGLLFQGEIVNLTNTKDFFLNNYFYTTQARLISQDISDNIITNQEVLDLC